MPGYKRIVSYIYTYEKGERKENVGFVKTETRDEECRFVIHMRGAYAHGQAPYKAYLYAPREDYLLGVFLGELENKNGILEWKGSLETGDLKRMPYSLKDARGVWIEGSEGKRYASEWEGYPVRVDSFQIYEETQETPFEQLPAEQPYEVQEIEAVPSTEEAGKEGGEEIQMPKETEQQDGGEALLQDGEPGQQAGEEVLRQDREPGQQVRELGQQGGEEPLQQDRETGQPQEGPGQQDRQTEMPGIQPQARTEQPLEAQTVKGDSRQEKWEYLAGRFPVQKLFQNGRAPMSCIRIGPRDLQRLPRGNWILGNNSFLLHGYYQYRHLLLCRQEEDGKPEYYLAVPGVYNEREKMMADLFGFEEFRRSRNTGNRGGNYGYWFRRIEEGPEEA